MNVDGPHRRQWMKTTAMMGAGAAMAGKLCTAHAQDEMPCEIVDLDSRRELFVDSFLFDHLDGLQLQRHEPRPAPPMEPLHGKLEYATVIKDGALYRLYTRDGRAAQFDGDENELTRYYESDDGVHWRAPRLGIVTWEGDTDNNIILHERFVCHNFSPFLDTRPGEVSDRRFKALAGVHNGGGLIAFHSSDGVHWTRLQDAPVIQSDAFAFDSQNVSFWSELEECYVCYFRTWKTPHGSLRTISRTTSADFLHWSEPRALEPNFPGEHLYTSLTHPYFRAPQIYVATPTRFHGSRGNSTDILFMTARGDTPYDRTFRDAWIRPGLDPERWGNRANYAALNVVPTGPAEMSIYATPFRRLTLRLDGFSSLHAGADSGEMITRPIRFKGASLNINYASSAGGRLAVEFQDLEGRPISGFALDDCQPLVGDSIEQAVAWKGGGDLSSLVGTPLKMRLVLQEADLFSLQFTG